MAVYRIDPCNADADSLVHVAVLGPALCAGFPSPADGFLEGARELPRWLAPNPPATFAWNIAGDSMRDAGIFDRDLAVVDRSLTPESGSVAAAVDGRMSIKRYRSDGDRTVSRG